MGKNIVLVGFMGTGKTVTGHVIAHRLERLFIDMDQCIEEREGQAISDIFATKGEAHFRALERALTQELSQQEDLVISTGGGIVLNPANIEDFSRTGLVVCLLTDPNTILHRVSKQSHRPLLEGDDKSRKIQELWTKRRPLYEAIPLCIDTTHHTAEDTAEEVIALYMGDAI